MPYKEHPSFAAPGDEQVKIWRYMDFTKFVSLIDRRELFFARADLLGDPFEGSLAQANVDLRFRIYEGLPVDMAAKMSRFRRDFRQFVFVNCWHMNDQESAAMWKLYLSSSEGIAVRSTYDRLISSVTGDAPTVYVGVVRYADYEADFIPEGNLFDALLHKRKSFEHERELRAVVRGELPPDEGSGARFDKPLREGGMYVGVDLGQLIEAVYIAPDAPPWFLELVASVKGRYGAPGELIQSKLDADPLF